VSKCLEKPVEPKHEGDEEREEPAEEEGMEEEVLGTYFTIPTVIHASCSYKVVTTQSILHRTKLLGGHDTT